MLLNTNTKRIFLVDAVGAVLSAIFLGVVLVSLNNLTGVPPSSLYFLAVFPILFAVYDAYCYRLNGPVNQNHVKGIAYLNIAYSVLSLCIVIYHRHTITAWGLVYFALEIAVIGCLVWLELRLAYSQRPISLKSGDVNVKQQ